MEEAQVLSGAYFRLSADNDRATDVVASLRKMQRSGEICDVSLCTECGGTVPVHKAVMATVSPYFKAMFASDLVEKSQERIILKEVDFDILQFIVAFAYNDRAVISKERLQALLFGADLFQISVIIEACCESLMTQITPNNCLSFTALADLHHCKWFHDSCMDYTLKHYEDVICTEEFLSLPCEQLKQLISRDEIRVPSEETVYNSVLQWVYHNLESRKEMVASVMGCVRLPFVSTEFLSNHVEQEDLLLSEELCKDYIQEALLYKSSPEKRSILKNSPRTRPRKPCGVKDAMVAIGGMGRDGPVTTVEQFDLTTDTWSTLTELNSARFGVATCCLNGCLYVVGGCVDTAADCTVLRYNLATGKWTAVQPMNFQRRYHKCEVLYGLIYSVGGQNFEGVSSSVERYDPITDTWTFIQPMIDSRMYHGLAEMGGYLFSIGGYNGQSRLCSAEFYDPAINVWKAVRSLSTPRSVPGVQRLGGSIYVVGGFDGTVFLNSVECYDIELDKWFPCPRLQERRSALGLVNYNGCLYACGGFDGSFLDSVERLALGADAWEPCVAMTVAKAHFGITST